MCARAGRRAGSLKGNELVSSHQAAALLQRSLGEFLVLTGTDMLFSLYPSPPFLVSLPISLSPLPFLLPFISLSICHSVFFLPPTPTFSLLLPPSPIDILFLCHRGSSLKSPPLGRTALHGHAKLRLSMIHPLVTVERSVAITLLGAKSQQPVLGWPSSGRFEAGGFAEPR